MKKKNRHEFVDNLIRNMSLRQKIGQMNQIMYDGDNFDEVTDFIKEYAPGSLILCGSAYSGNEEQTTVRADLINKLQSTAIKSGAGIPLLMGRDVIHGHKVIFPNLLAMAASFDTEAIKNAYNDIREEAYNDGIRWSFTPMLDLSRDPRWGRIVESPGEDPYLSGKIAKAVVEGFQTDSLANDGSIAACCKHFVGYGASEGGRDYHHTEISDFSLQNYHLPAFREGINAGAATVMTAFNDFNGYPATSNKRLITDILRNQMGFEGFTVSDWGSVCATVRQGIAADRNKAAELSVKAGLDMDMTSKAYLDEIEELVNSGKVPEYLIDCSVRRILNIKYEMGLFEKPFVQPIKCDYNKHLHDSLEMAEKSAVLLKNNDDLLPLDTETKIYATGNFIDDTENHLGTWALESGHFKLTSLADELHLISKNAVVENVFDISSAKKADVILLALGEPRSRTGEAHSVARLELAEDEKSLIKLAKKTGKKIVGVFFFARPIAFDGIEDYFDVILYAWHGGTCHTKALARLIYGFATPSGKLPVTLPRATGQIPIYYNAPPTLQGFARYYGDNNSHIKSYDDCPATPAFPFGFGLSYTRFKYGNIKTDKETMSIEALKHNAVFKVSVEVGNIGNADATETVQLYLKHNTASRILPVKMLKGFKRIHLKSGEVKKAEFELGSDELGFYLENGDYILEPCEITVFIGGDCNSDNVISLAISE